jgi:hypothetical protein
MRSTSRDRYAIGNEQLRHAQRHSEIGSAVVNARQYMAMQIDHRIKRTDH